MKLTRFNELLEEGRVVKGHWVFGKNNEVQYRGEGKDEEVKLKGSIIAVEPGTLLLAVTARQTDQKIVTSILKLSGAWRVDSKNRINFQVEKEKGKNDILTFKGAWQVGESHEILYSCETTYLKTKKKELKTIVFNGTWDISERNCLTYSLAGSSDASFRFRGAFQTKSILAKNAEIRYQAGVEAAGKFKIQTIILFGKWKVSRDLGLSFEIEYAGGRKKAISFGGQYSIDKNHQIIVQLGNQEGKPLGIELVLTKEFIVDQAQAFLRLRKSFEESRIEAGMRFNF